MQEVENIKNEHLDDLAVELRYSQCVSPLLDDIEEMIKIVFSEDGPEIFFYPENVGGGGLIEELARVEGLQPTDTCAFCQEATEEDVYPYELKKSTIVHAHKGCKSILYECLLEFCSDPRILAKNI